MLDDRPGSRAEVSLARPGPLRVYAHVRGSTDPADLTGLRVLLATDLLTRAAELGGLQVLGTRAFAGQRAAVESAAVALDIRPPALPAADLAEAWPGGPADVHITDDAAPGMDNRPGIVVRVAAARLAQDASPAEATADVLGGHDPLAVRLALMSLARHQPAVLTSGTLADAARTLDGWRRRVAHWAESPSAAIPAPIAATLRTAFESQDITAVLTLLSGLADDEAMSTGARFETFVYADRVLSLDLPRHIGR